ncbi:GNAT family N-acetyltransferase [Frondihabitans cladoniiphilus]|uniref:GNAT family N-acetyltransferase n=1 Tax=Frondihabitans cladoniiphilus TaxID=715785 RepID=A0ABP8W153_9MICO
MVVTHHESLTRELDPVVLYKILQLRVDVFVVEQECPYPELDGRDVEPRTRQFWTTDETGAVLATLRLLTEGDDDGDDRRIGRVATARDARGHGYAGVLLEQAVARASGHAIHLDAQSRLEPWYARYGFVRSGDDFLEDDILHVPMTRSAS